MNKFFFQVEFAKGISDADILSFCDRLESDLKRKNMWEQLNSGKLHMLLEQLSQCNCVSS